jgi:hypothetical protein
MKKLLFFMLITSIIFIFQAVAMACQSDADCQPGSKCVQSSVLIPGVCVWGPPPGNQNDQKSVYSTTDPNRTNGKTCQFNTDCGPGSECVKSSGMGVCIQK